MRAEIRSEEHKRARQREPAEIGVCVVRFVVCVGRGKTTMAVTRR